jgi:hypothetical protein
VAIRNAANAEARFLTLNPKKWNRPSKRIGVWFCTFVVGLLFGQFALNEWSERQAAPILFGWRQKSMPEPRIRFIDFSHLYKVGTRSVSAKDLLALIEAAKKLDGDERPLAIAIDLPLFKRLEDQAGWQVPEGTPALMARINELREELPVVIGVADFVKDKQLDRLAPGTSGTLASAYLYDKDDLAVMAFGQGTRSDVLPSLGIAASMEALRQEGNLESSGHAFGPSHLVEPPKEWPQGLLAAPKWMVVDYSILRRKESLTVMAGQNLQEGDVVTEVNILTSDDRRKLKARGKGTIWMVGIASVEEKEDTFTYDPDSGWRSESEPIRRVYQHGAIAHTYLDQPLHRMGDIADKLLDLFCSLIGLGFVLLIDKAFPGLEERKVLHALSKIALLAAAIGIAVLVSRGLVMLGWFWFGFAGTALYALVEGFVSPVWEAIIGMEHPSDSV